MTDGHFYVTKTFNPGKGYSCCFRQHGAKSHCRFIHGYDLIFAVTFTATELDETGWVLDFGALKPLKDIIEKTFDHKLVLAMDDPYLDELSQLQGLGIADVVVLPKVGCEAFALWLAVEATNVLQDLGQLDRVRVHTAQVYEHSANSASYRP